MQDNEEELRINSEIIWNFDDVNKELISAYPNGKSITECLVTIDGLYTWEIEFFPNGKDMESLNHLYVSLKLKNIKEGVSDDVNAECNYYIINKADNKNYAGRILRRKFVTSQAETDFGFETKVLGDCKDCVMISLNITQYPSDSELLSKKALEEVGSTAESTISQDPNFSEEDFQKVSVQSVY